jgi:3-phenylpropionate/trans-cinnamate dioxygenase ferredoxin reductase subunit
LPYQSAFGNVAAAWEAVKSAASDTQERDVTVQPCDQIPDLPDSRGPSIVLLGGGQAAYVTARTLRQDGFSGPITIVGDEPHPPYERPPLSKAVLLGSAPIASTYMATRDQLVAQQIEWIEARAEEIDPDVRIVRLGDGRELSYDRLVIATGGEARCLQAPGDDLAGIHALRSISDAEEIGSKLKPDAAVVIIGGGWIGLEVAASARQAGANVVLVEVLEQLCARTLPAVAAEYLLCLHRDAGVEMLLGRRVRGYVGNDRVKAVELDDGTLLPADLVVVGVGMIPNSDLARRASLEVASGIVVDEDCRTSDPNIFAVGDVAEVRRGDSLSRTESWANANEQAATAAAALLGLTRPERPAPWFWSDQYESNIQILGDVRRGTKPVVIGDPGRGAVSWIYVSGDRLAGVIAVNRPRDVQAARRIMQRGVATTIEAIKAIAATDGDLSELLRQPAIK